MGVVCAIGGNIGEFGTALEEGRDGIAEISRFPTDGMRSTCGGEIRPAAAWTRSRIRGKPADLASVLTLRAAREAVTSDSADLIGDDRQRIAVTMGSCGGGYLRAFEYLEGALAGRRRIGNLLLDAPLHAAASHVAQEFGLMGGVSVVSNACASSAVAVALGMEQIRSGRAAAAIVGGYETLSPLSCAGFGAMRNSSPGNRIRPFDRDRDGLLLGEGAGVLLLESAERCRRRGGEVHARLLGYGLASDSYHPTAPDPSGRGAATAMSQALEDGRVEAAEVDYVNAHGTATRYNDRMEVYAARRVFGERARRLPMSSTKSMIGHTLGAAGAIELIASILAMRGGFVPPTINFENPDPACELDCVPNEARALPIRLFMSNSFGFGGTNCSLLAGRP
jgi:3-oxoacyl-[acyl-carrier-protein] synthase II